MDFTCPRCRKVFSRKYNYNRHIHKNTQCVIKNKIIKRSKSAPECSKGKKIICELCFRTFTKNFSLVRHLNGRCPNLNLKGQSFNTNTTNNTTQNNVNSNNTFNVNNKIQLLNFGEEKLNHLDDNIMNRICSRYYNAMSELLSYIHLDPKVPENHNLLVTSLTSGYAKVFDGKWKTMLIDQAIGEAYGTNFHLLLDYYERNKNQLSEITRRHLGNFLKEHNNKDIRNKSEKQILMTLYDGHDIPLLTKNKIEYLSRDDNDQRSKRLKYFKNRRKVIKRKKRRKTLVDKKYDRLMFVHNLIIDI
jgi:hypothetical protein